LRRCSRLARIYEGWNLSWTRLELAIDFIARLIAPGVMQPIYAKLLHTYIDASGLQDMQSIANLFSETNELMRSAQHVYQTMEQGARAASSQEWFKLSALADLVLGKISHELVRVFFADILHEAGQCFGSLMYSGRTLRSPPKTCAKLLGASGFASRDNRGFGVTRLQWRMFPFSPPNFAVEGRDFSVQRLTLRWDSQGLGDVRRDLLPCSRFDV
jgi:hypothetical protein